MKYTRILLGGLLAGVIINVGEGVLWAVLLAEQNEAMMASYGLTEASWAMAGYVITVFILGLVLAWLYAAIRPRFGEGVQTALMAGVALWLAVWVVPTVWFAAGGLGLGMGATLLALAWGLVEVALAAYAAGWVYQEQEAPATAPAAAPGANTY